MDNIFYRVLNPTFEPASQVLSSTFRSDYRQQVFAYRKLSYAIYMFTYSGAYPFRNSEA